MLCIDFPPRLCYNIPIKDGVDMRKIQRNSGIVTGVALFVAVIIFLIFSTFNIERHTWVLSTAQQVEVPPFVVAHHPDRDVSEIPMSEFSKPIELICEAKGGKLILTDKTNEKTYEGTYEISSLGFGKLGFSKGTHYTIVIEGAEGTAIISSSFGREMFMSVDNYSLIFEAE